MAGGRLWGFAPSRRYVADFGLTSQECYNYEEAGFNAPKGCVVGQVLCSAVACCAINSSHSAAAWRIPPVVGMAHAVCLLSHVDCRLPVRFAGFAGALLLPVACRAPVLSQLRQRLQA